MRSKETPGVHPATRRRLAFVLVCMPTLFGHTVADDLCGTTIVAHLTLSHDLTCAGNGLTIGADGIKVDLNGHTIMGSASGVGIDVTGRTGISVVGGTIRNFEAGVRVNSSTGSVIKGNTFRENSEGVDCQAGCVDNTIKENEFSDNRRRGIMLRSNSIDNVIKENTFTGDRVGILVFGGRDSIVKQNFVSASRLAGIRVNVIATGNLIVENTVTANPAGVEFLVTATGSAIGNTVAENWITTNTCGLKGPTDGNTLRENVFEGNGADSCP